MIYFEDLEFVGADEVPHCVFDVCFSHAHLFVLNYVRCGRVFFEFEHGERQILDGPVVFWTLPEYFYHYGNVAPYPWNQAWVSVRGPRLSKMLDQGLILSEPPHYQFLRRRSAVEEPLYELINLVLSARDTDQSRRVLLFELIWVELNLQQETKSTPCCGIEEAVDRLAQKIALDPTAEVDFRAEAQSLGISYDHYRRSFRNVNGLAPQAYRTSCLMRLAAKTLEEGRLSVAETAFLYGFDDAHYFSRLFKKRTGLSPSDYRQRGKVQAVENTTMNVASIRR